MDTAFSKAVAALCALSLVLSIAAFSVAKGAGDGASGGFGGTTHVTNLGVKGGITAGTTLGVTGAATVGSTLGVTGASTLTGGAKVGTQYSATNPLQFLNATATAPSANYCDSAAEGGSLFLATSTSYVRLYVCTYHASSTRGWDYATLTN